MLAQAGGNVAAILSTLKLQVCRLKIPFMLIKLFCLVLFRYSEEIDGRSFWASHFWCFRRRAKYLYTLSCSFYLKQKKVVTSHEWISSSQMRIGYFHTFILQDVELANSTIWNNTKILQIHNNIKISAINCCPITYCIWTRTAVSTNVFFSLKLKQRVKFLLC